MSQPNILLVVLDTARADALEPYGATPGASPTVADLARTGEAVEQVYAPSSWTLPTHGALFTGSLPRALGLGQAPEGRPEGVRPRLRSLSDRLLPSVLRRAGYATAAASCNVWISEASGFDTGFDEFSYVPSPRGGLLDEGFSAATQRLWEGLRARRDDGARRVGTLLRRWLRERDRQRPFFWFVNLTECHSPYLPPRPYNDLPAWQRLRAAADVGRYQSLEAIWRHCTTDARVPSDALARMRYLYSRAIRAMDDWLARLLRSLEEARVLDDTIVVVTSDHGENFGENGLYGHAFSLDDRLIRVPLVSSRPLPWPRSGPASLVDLPAALTRAAGLDDLRWPASPDGPAVIAQFDPLADRDDPRVRQVAREWGLDDRGVAMFTEPLTCATDGVRKVVRHGSEERVYDLTGDPLETQPVASAGPGIEPLRAALDSERAWAAPARDGHPPGPTDREEIEALEEQMRLLGYM